MKKYLVTGYSKKDNKMATHVYDDIESVAQLIEMCAGGQAKIGESVIPSVKDLDFDVQSRASHSGAEIINDKDYCWSIFLLK